MKTIKKSLILSLTLMLTTVSAFAAGDVWYISTSGTSSTTGNAGSKENPWNLVTGLKHRTSGNIVKPGDIVYLRGGTYTITGNITSDLQGNLSNPIEVRVAPGEYAKIDLKNGYNLQIEGKYTHYYDFEVMNSSLDRGGKNTDPKKPPIRGTLRVGNYVGTTGVKLINLFVHDLAVGISFWVGAYNSEIYGCIIYNNGYDAKDRNHGHGIYVQNLAESAKLISDNIIFNQFGYGIHAYTEDTSVNKLCALDIQRNISFNNGTSSRWERSEPNITVRNASKKFPAKIINITQNHFFHSSGLNEVNVELGKSIDNMTHEDLTFSNNYIKGGSWALSIDKWKPVTANKIAVTKNQILCLKLVSISSSNTASDFNMTSNRYYSSNTSPFSIGTSSKTFSQWKSAGYDNGTGVNESTLSNYNTPLSTQILVNNNKYESGRANIVVYNWGKSPSVSVDLSGIGFCCGDQYEIYNVQDSSSRKNSPFGPPVVTGFYAGEVTKTNIPTPSSSTGIPPILPIGITNPSEINHKITASEGFNVFVIRKVNSGREIEITGNVTWNTCATVHGTFIINPGATLTVQSAFISLTPTSSIIVKPGGKLVITGGSKLTSACDGKLWKGIVVLGTNATPQNESNKGTVIISGGTIEHAMIAINAYLETGPPVVSSGGGIIKAEFANFINNHQSIIYRPYENKNSNGAIIDNEGMFKVCNFTINNNNYFTANGLQFNWHIYMHGVRGIDFWGCKFSNSSNPNPPYRGTGINASSSGFRLNEYCYTYLWEDCNCLPISSTPTVFEYLSNGFYVSNSNGNYKVSADVCEFKNVTCGATFSTFNNFQFIRSKFNNFRDGLISNYSTGYQIEENNFWNNTTTVNSYALSILHSGSANNLVYSNNISNVGTGIYVDGENFNIFDRTGLLIVCNKFENCKDGIFLNWGSTISENQGSILKGVDNCFINTNRSLHIGAMSNPYDFHYYHSNSNSCYTPVNNYFYLGGTIIGNANSNPCEPTFCHFSKSKNNDPQQDLSINSYIEMQTQRDQLLNQFEANGYGYILKNYQSGVFPEELIMEALLFSGKISELNDKMRELSDNSISNILGDSILNTNMLKAWYNVVRTPIAKYLLAETHFFTNDYELADAVLYSIPDMFVFSEKDYAEHANYMLFHNFKKQLQLSERDWSDLNESEISYLQRIADANTGRSSAMAQGVLCFFYQICYELEIPKTVEIPDLTPKFTKDEQTEPIIVNESGLSIYPNPAQTEIIVSINKSDVYLKHIELYDSFGQMIIKKIINKSIEIIKIDNILDGIYVIKVYLNNNETIIQKFVKQQ